MNNAFPHPSQKIHLHRQRRKSRAPARGQNGKFAAADAHIRNRA